MPARDLDALTEVTESEPAQYACAICGRLREAHSTFLVTGLLTCERIACRKRALTLDADYPAPPPPSAQRRQSRRRGPPLVVPPVVAVEVARYVAPPRPRAPFVPPPMNAHALLLDAKASAVRPCDGCGHPRRAHRGRSCLAADGLCQCGGFSED